MCRRQRGKVNTHSSRKLGRLAKASGLREASLLCPRFLKYKKQRMCFKSECRSHLLTELRISLAACQSVVSNPLFLAFKTKKDSDKLQQLQLHLPFDKQPHPSACLKTLQRINPAGLPWRERSGSILSIQSASLLAHFPNTTRGPSICSSRFAL